MAEDALTLADASAHRNPGPLYDRLRKDVPVYRDPVLGFWVITSDRLVRDILSNHQDFSSVPDPRYMAIYADDPEIVTLYQEAGCHMPMNTLVTTDPPMHRRYRSLVERALGATSVRRMQGSIAAVADELIDGFLCDGRCDLVESFSLMLPVFVIGDLLGVSRDHVGTLRAMAEATTRLADGTMIDREAVLDCHRIQIAGQKIFDEYIARYNATKADNLLSHLIHADSDGQDRLSSREIHSIIQALLVGGNDTTPGAISSAVLHLARDGVRQRLLRAEPALIGNFVEEVLRLESPVQGMYRFARYDVVLDGVKISAGDAINVRFGAANLDPAAYPVPNEMNTERRGIRNHLAFGGGIHYCVGNILARLEISTAVAHLLKRLAEIRLEAHDFDVRYVEKLVIRNPISVPIVFEARTADVPRNGLLAPDPEHSSA